MTASSVVAMRGAADDGHQQPVRISYWLMRVPESSTGRVT
jgi:hypothetical protein